MFAFSNKNIEFNKLENMYFSLEGDFELKSSEELNILKLIKTLENKYFIRNIEDSSAYHLANVMVSNLVLSLLSIGTSYLCDIGLSEQDAIKALYPLIHGNIQSIYNNGFTNSLTGPILRGDVSTVKKHLQALKDEHIGIYKDLSMNLLNLVGKSKLNYDEKNLLINNENALDTLINDSKKHKDIYELLGGLE